MNRGFTLIELVLSLALLSMALMLVFYIFSFSYYNYVRFNEEIEAQQNLRYAMHRIISEIKRVNDADKVLVKDGGKKIVLLKYDNNTPEVDIYYVPHEKVINMHSRANGVELAHGVEDFHVNLDGDKLVMYIKVRNKVLSSTIKLMYNNGD
ncbi:prepilin-type N-terminal cleavage/methylation domain-containing protein [Caldanaerobius polysaccharolyticus]|uniref:prepilin-type N-terminal cleavage/methylation domain-containing protein n=1 Tax=Caldanaerobius polysaccharolyticus TaxID=44256 RepID=UPI00047BCED3|nr:prepilin-type N-terminal cleavage/methylation domain-containing protein [Caldanaerobius polysaccharolyticus]